MSDEPSIVSVETPERDWSYDRTKDGWDIPWVTTKTVFSNGTVVKSTGAPEVRVRPEEERVRCGPYKTPGRDGKSWGDHRVTYRGSTCVETECQVAHHPDIYPGWAEPMEDWQDREGVQPIAAALEGWDAAGHMTDRIGSMTAWIAAHVALDALRDAGYEVVKRRDTPNE